MKIPLARLMLLSLALALPGCAGYYGNGGYGYGGYSHRHASYPGYYYGGGAGYGRSGYGNGFSGYAWPGGPASGYQRHWNDGPRFQRGNGYGYQPPRQEHHGGNGFQRPAPQWQPNPAQAQRRRQLEAENLQHWQQAQQRKLHEIQSRPAPAWGGQQPSPQMGQPPRAGGGQGPGRRRPQQD